jgi:cytochrome P450 family 4
MFFVIFALLTLACCLLYQVRYHHRNSLLARIPSHRKLPFIHNALEFSGRSPKEIFDWLEESKTKLGSVFHYTFTPFDDGTVIVSHPKVAEGILSSQKLIDKGFDYDLMNEWLGNGLLMSTGKKWHQRRKILTPAFHFRILEKFVEIMEDQGKVFEDELSKLHGQEIDAFNLVNLYALDVICGEQKM